MSFICKSCGVAQEAGTKPVKVVVETRNVYYPPIKDDNGNVRIPVGFETVRELDICNLCFETKDFNCVVVGNKILE
jgi:hypothetical protein